ncbi:squalene/phytoene synthase family protein [Sphingomonas sp. A2-49]|uniref:squalene/phytoene synthase family protein n=1 Tax=Sphingomonas sp. A2-49 TaxID=1391375 RepID=UPI0021CF9367|nr:squalene/phytoene synthase family protein [Sphingomonas sp. A2-49]MCU6452709.1 squalene/phytoene synthase family protein [Sphingomonas sp. A2-49]
MTDPNPDALPADRALVVATAPAVARDALHTLFALDLRLAAIVRAAREPMIGQMRLAWWHDALGRLDGADAPAEPLLQAVQAHLVPAGIRGDALAALIDGWEALIAADTLDDAALMRHAESRGAGLFVLLGRVLGTDSPLLAPAGRGWAFADLAGHLSVERAAADAAALARAQWSQAFSKRWPRPLRVIGLLSLVSYLDDRGGSPFANALRTTRFRIDGR